MVIGACSSNKRIHSVSFSKEEQTVELLFQKMELIAFRKRIADVEIAYRLPGPAIPKGRYEDWNAARPLMRSSFDNLFRINVRDIFF